MAILPTHRPPQRRRREGSCLRQDAPAEAFTRPVNRRAPTTPGRDAERRPSPCALLIRHSPGCFDFHNGGTCAGNRTAQFCAPGLQRRHAEEGHAYVVSIGAILCPNSRSRASDAIRCREAAARFFPGSLTRDGLKHQIRRGRLRAALIAGRYFVTEADILAMCQAARQRNAPNVLTRLTCAFGTCSLRSRSTSRCLACNRDSGKMAKVSLRSGTTGSAQQAPRICRRLSCVSNGVALFELAYLVRRPGVMPAGGRGLNSQIARQIGRHLLLRRRPLEQRFLAPRLAWRWR